MIKRSTILALPLAVAAANASAYTFITNPIGAPLKWGDSTLGTGADITWSLMPDGTPCGVTTCTALDSFMPDGYLSDIQNAFDTWSAAADLSFTLVDEVVEDGEVVSSGDLRLGGYGIDGAGGTLANAYSYSNWYKLSELHFDSSENWGVEVDVFSVALHEIGHVLGLDHSDAQGSVMNHLYNPNDPLTGLGEDDIAAVQALYGPANIAEVPVPGAAWLFGSAVLMLGGRAVRATAREQG